MTITPTRYYDEFLRYYEMAKVQQAECNLGTTPHMQGSVTDPLMRHVELYDVVERKYAGFTQIVLDLWYGNTPHHPYAKKLHSVRRPICESVTPGKWSMVDWLYVFIVHRVTGSGINYAKKPSGYNNTILPELAKCRDMAHMVEVIANRPDNSGPIYTSVGYQFPAFPKPYGKFKRGGDLFLCKYAPTLAMDLASFMRDHWKINRQLTLREIGQRMFDWNAEHGLRAYRFQYAAVVADIADFFTDYVDLSSPFYYGSNAVECISYLADPVGRCSTNEFLDAVMMRIQEDTGAFPYNAEDVCCDFIRWIENYVRPGHDYDHVDRDNVWNSSTITDHPFGRQKAMLDLGLVKSFNDMSVHPSDNYVLAQNGLSVDDYRFML